METVGERVSLWRPEGRCVLAAALVRRRSEAGQRGDGPPPAAGRARTTGRRCRTHADGRRSGMVPKVLVVDFRVRVRLGERALAMSLAFSDDIGRW